MKMKTVKKIFTALFMIAPFTGAMADTSEYDKCISDIEYEIFSGHRESVFGNSSLDSLLKNKDTLSEKNKYTLSEAEKTELKKQIKAVADKVLDTPMTESGSVKCNGTPYTINIGDTLREKIPQACHKYTYAAEQKEVEENFAKNKCQHLKTTATSEGNSSSSDPRAGRNDKNRANERETPEPGYLEPSVATPPSFGNDMTTPPVAPKTDEESDDEKKEKKSAKKEEAEKNCKKENFTGAESVKWTGKKCEITACEKPKYKLSKNQCVSTDGEKCTPTDTNATSGKMSNGQCLITECKCGYKNIHQTNCAAKESHEFTTCTSKDDNADSAQFACNEKGTEYCKIITCKDGFKPDEKTNKCISSDSAQAKCTNTNLPDGVTEQKWNNSLKRCLHTKCDETNYKLVNSECVPKPCEPKDIEHSKTGEMKGGKCELKTCETGYEPKDGKCAPTEKTATKDANAKKKELCDKFDKKYGKWDPIKRECKCNDGLKWEDNKGCVAKTTAELEAEKAACNKDEIEGAATATWSGNVCTITCDTNTHEATPVDGKCVKKPSAAFTQSKTKLEELFKTAKEALEALKGKEQKESKQEARA